MNLSLLLNELNEFTSIPTLEKSNEVDHTQDNNINSTSHLSISQFVHYQQSIFTFVDCLRTYQLPHLPQILSLGINSHRALMEIQSQVVDPHIWYSYVECRPHCQHCLFLKGQFPCSSHSLITNLRRILSHRLGDVMSQLLVLDCKTEILVDSRELLPIFRLLFLTMCS